MKTLKIILLILVFVFIVQNQTFATNEEYGWLEVQATVPEGFNRDIVVVLFDSSDNMYEFFLYPVNNYKINKKLPFGDYIMVQAMVEFDNKAEFPVDWDAEFSIDNDRVAKLVEVTVTNDSLLTKPEPKQDVELDKADEKNEEENNEETENVEDNKEEDLVDIEDSVIETEVKEDEENEVNLLAIIIFVVIILIVIILIFAFFSKFKD